MVERLIWFWNCWGKLVANIRYEEYSQNLFEILLAFLVMLLSIMNVSDIALLLGFSPN